MITLTNTLTGVKEPFKPLQSRYNNSVPMTSVRLYVCGITPYDYAHIGHGRVYVCFDVLYRLLTYLGYDVTYCRNFTDIDDKIIRKAEQTCGSSVCYRDITQRYMNAFHEDMKALNCLAPTYEPCVTDNIDVIIAFIKGLVDAGKAYVVNGDVYFAIDQFPAYGALSKHKLEDLRAGARVEVNENKRDPLDFALWKAEPEGMFWQSPWGYGRPGWHIECSALAHKFLGDTIDIHAGGLDLVFPHHENEKAQSEALLNVPFVRYWMHNGFVRINEEKMSKSLGNFFTLRDVFKQVDPMVVRFYLLSHQYRTPLDFSFEGLQVADKTYRKLCRVLEHVPNDDASVTPQEYNRVSLVQEMLDFLCDDLNTPGMFGVLFGALHTLSQDQNVARAAKGFIQRVLGLTLAPLPEHEVIITPAIQQLLDEREQARAARDWARADQLREQLRTLGVQVQDKKKVT